MQRSKGGGEDDEATHKLGGARGLQALEEQGPDVGRVGCQRGQRHAAAVQRIQQEEALVVQRARGDQLLEDAQDGGEVAAGDDLGGGGCEVGPHQADQCRGVPGPLPEGGREERREEGHVGGGKRRAGLPRLQQLGKDLEDVGVELLCCMWVSGEGF